MPDTAPMRGESEEEASDRMGALKFLLRFFGMMLSVHRPAVSMQRLTEPKPTDTYFQLRKTSAVCNFGVRRTVGLFSKTIEALLIKTIEATSLRNVSCS